jgi:hypothetical protein
MDVNSFKDKVGKSGTIVVENGLIVCVKILNVKNSYGNIRYQVTPISGSNEVWMDESKVKIEDK